MYQAVPQAVHPVPRHLSDKCRRVLINHINISTVRVSHYIYVTEALQPYLHSALQARGCAEELFWSKVMASS